jgi:hypothetical protein
MKKLNNFFKGFKKAQIGSTLTWFVAFLIIFFIIILFLSASIISSGRKKVTTGWDDIKFKDYEGDLSSQRILFQTLNSKVIYEGNSVRLKDILAKTDFYNLDSGKKSELKLTLKDIIDNLLKLYTGSGKCYVFKALYGIDEDKILSNSYGQGLSDFIDRSTLEISSFSDDSISLRATGNLKSRLLSKSSDLVLLRDTTTNVFGVDEKQNQIITIKFYAGECL